MKQKILVAVTGMTPQIVTETVYALHKNHQWLPEKIIVLTTLQGKQKIMDTLLGKNNQLARLQQDYALPEIQFNEQNIKVISENNQELDDIRTAQQNNAAADLIVREIYQLCQDKNTELHVSIAGGRKSMGFYVGYALSLFGRAQDKMSHVLVEEGFEQHQEFFYPPAQSQMLTMRSENNQQRDAAKAEIMLAEIPFVRMLDNRLQFAFDKNMTFSEAVFHTQQVLNHSLQICFHCADCTISIGEHTQFKLEGRFFAAYVALAARKLRNQTVQFHNETQIQQFAKEYLSYYQQYDTKLLGDSTYAKEERRLKLADLESTKKVSSSKQRSEIERIFGETKSAVAKQLKKQLGEYGRNFEIVSFGKNTQLSYDLNTPPELIKIIE